MLKRSDEELKKIAWDFYKKTPEPSPTMLDRVISDAATAHALQEATDLLVKHGILARIDGRLASAFEDFCFAWQALLAEAGIEEAK